MGEQQSFRWWSTASATCALLSLAVWLLWAGPITAVAQPAQTDADYFKKLLDPAEIKKQKANYDAALASATNTIPYAKQFLKLFPNSNTNIIVDDIGFSYYTGVIGPSRFRIHTYLFQRYELQMSALVTFDETRRKVVSFKKPEFRIMEIADLSTGEPKTGVDPSGAPVTSSPQWSIRYNNQNGRDFGPKDWKKIVAANGDFSAIGYSIKTNAPAPRFQEFMDRGKGQ